MMKYEANNKTNKMKTDMKGVSNAINQIFPSDMTKDNTLFVCIGTDRSTGDSLGPLVGTKLKQRGYNVLGTIKNPVHAMNLEDIVKALPKDKYIVGIDATLGLAASVGTIDIRKGAITPGAGVGKELPPVGDYSIGGIVNVGGFMEYYVLRSTRLLLVMNMADAIVKGVHKRFGARSLVAVSRDY